MDNLVVQTHALTKRYGQDILAVDSLNLNVRAGEVYGFLGPNGAGKTTTLRMLLGLIRPTSGSARVVDQAPGDPLGLAKIGALVESPAFYPYLSGLDNLRVVARFCGAPESRIQHALDNVELSSRAKDKFSTYSMGMKQRLGVAAALLKDAQLLILDEPSNGLDPQGIHDMRQLLKGLGQGNRTVLVSSHLLGEVEQICDRVGVIRSGRLIAEGTVDEVRGSASGILVRAAPVERAKEVISQLLGEGHVHAATDGLLSVSIDLSRAAEVNRVLVGGGVDVSELRPQERSLEQVFLELTGEGTQT
jgi:ABC-2 type transport system ATP-binding protein